MIARIGLAGCAVAMIAAWTPVVLEGGRGSSARLVQSTCTVNCWQPSAGCAEDEHTAPTSDNPHNRVGAGPHSTCYSGDCEVKHPDCTPGFAAHYDALKSALEREQPSAILVGLKAFGAQGAINHDRHAIQLIGCNNRIVAHIPLTDELWNRLRDLAE